MRSELDKFLEDENRRLGQENRRAASLIEVLSAENRKLHEMLGRAITRADILAKLEALRLEVVAHDPC